MRQICSHCFDPPPGHYQNLDYFQASDQCLKTKNLVFWILQICFPNPTFILIRSGNYHQDFLFSPWRSWWSRCCKRLFRKHRIFWSSSFWKSFCSSFWNLSIGLHEWAQSIWSENSLFLFRPFHFLARSAWVEYRCYSYAQQYLNP